MSNDPEENFEKEIAKSSKIFSFYFRTYIFATISFAWILFAMYKIALLYFPTITFFMIFKFFMIYSLLELISKGFYYLIFNDEEKEIKLIK